MSVSAATLWGGKEETERLTAATETLTEMNTKISKDLANKAVCAFVVPGLKKGGLIVGGKYGRGFASCRNPKGGWTAPAGMRIEGGSFGLQVGGAESDVIILVMNKSGMEKLLKSKFTLGGDATAAAGPVGREAAAQTDAMMHAEMLTWARSKGVFGGSTRRLPLHRQIGLLKLPRLLLHSIQRAEQSLEHTAKNKSRKGPL